MAAESPAISLKPERWNAGLTRKHWRVLMGSYLGWLFDGYETFALIIALPFAMASLLTPEQSQSKSRATNTLDQPRSPNLRPHESGR